MKAVLIIARVVVVCPVMKVTKVVDVSPAVTRAGRVTEVSPARVVSEQSATIASHTGNKLIPTLLLLVESTSKNLISVTC